MLQSIITKLISAEEEIRRNAVQSLRDFPLDDSYPLLLQAMGDESWRVRKESVEVFVASSPKELHISALLDLFHSEDNAGQRNSAAEAVTRLGTVALTALIDKLNDPDADVRKFVIDVMGNIHCSECVMPLLSSLDDEDLNVASAAAEQLGNLGDSSVVPALLESISNRPSVFFRFNALAAIGKLAAPAPVPPVITELAGNDLLRKPVYECLGSIADESAFPLLLEGLSSKQKSSRNAALNSLYRIYIRSSYPVQQELTLMLHNYVGNSLVLTVKEAFSTDDFNHAEAVVTILDLIGDCRAVDIFLQAFLIERLSAVALKSIKRLYPESMINAVALYDTSDEKVRAAICILCAECQYLEGAGVVRKGLTDSSPFVRQAAATTVGKIGLLDLLQELVVLLDDEEAEVSNAAARSIQSLAFIDRVAIQQVANDLSCSVRSNRKRVAALLFASLGDGDKLNMLVKDEDPQVRQAAVHAMRVCHLAGVESILIMALVDEDPDVRIAATDAIGETGSAKLAETLVSALSDDDEWVKCAILRNIVKINPELGFTQIQNIFPTASGLLLLTCLQLLANYFSDQSIEMVRTMAGNPDRDISSLANEIISKYHSKRVPA